MRNALRWAAVLVAGGAVLVAAASPAQGRPDADQALGDSFATWTKKLNADFRDLNGTLRTGADSLAEYALRVGRLYLIAQRIQRDATKAEQEIQTKNPTSADSLLAKRRALKAFDLLRRSGEQWANYAKCTALGAGLTGFAAGCTIAEGQVDAGFFDVYFTLDEEIKARLEQDLQGYIRQAKQLSRNAAHLLRLANEGLGNPLKTPIVTTTKPIGDVPVVEPAALWEGDWSIHVLEDDGDSFQLGKLTFVQSGNTVCGVWDWNPFPDGRLGNGSGSLSGGVLTFNARDGFGPATWTDLKLGPGGTTWKGRYTVTQTATGIVITGAIDGTRAGGATRKVSCP